MSLGARGGAKGGAKGGSGKDRNQDKKDKPQPKEKVKPQATTEQIRLANMIDRKTSDDGADVRKKVQDLMEMTCRTEEEVCSALHDSDNDVVVACNILLEAVKTQGEWQTSEKKKKKPPQPVNNGEVPPAGRDRPHHGSRPRRGSGERGSGGEAARGGGGGGGGGGSGRGSAGRGRGGGRGGRGGGRGTRGLTRHRNDHRDWQQQQHNDSNQMGDAFPATEDWDNEEWSGSLSDTKVFTPSAAALPPSESEGAMLPPTEEWDSPVVTGAGVVAGSDPHAIPTYTYHNAAQHHANIELNSGRVASPGTSSESQLPPDHYHQIQQLAPVQPMGMSGSLTAAQSQYLSQLTQQSQRHDASVYSANYGVYGSTDIANQRKPQRARVPPPSKIPIHAVEMPGGEAASGMFLDVQFGALEPDALREPASTASHHKPQPQPQPQPLAQAATLPTTHVPHVPHVSSHVSSHVSHPSHVPAHVPLASHVTAGHVTASHVTAVSPPAGPEPAPEPAAAAQPTTHVSYTQHQQRLSDTLATVDSTAPSQPAQVIEPTATTNAQSALEKQLNASMKQLAVSAAESVASSTAAHQAYVTARPKQQQSATAAQQNVYAQHAVSHHPPAVYGASVYAPQVNSTNASLTAAAAGITTGYPSSVTLTQYQPILNSYQTSSSGGVYNNNALYTAAAAAAAPYSYQPQPQPQPQQHHKHKDAAHQYESSTTGATSSLASTSTTQTSSAKVASSSGSAPAAAAAAAYAPGALYGSQGYAYDETLMRSTMPHHMGGYYEVGYGVSGARDGTFGLGAGERFGRTDAASPQQVPAAALPPGYAYFYQPPPPTTYQYGVYPTYGGGSSVGGVGGVGAGGKVGNYAQQQQPQYDAQDTYKPGGGYANSGSKAGGAASTDLNTPMYGKAHVALNKVNSYEKAAFHSGTPPPFGAASHLYIPAPPHHHHVPQHQQEAGSTGGRANSNKTAHSKPTYSHSYWPPN